MNTHPLLHRHPELVSGPIARFTRRVRHGQGGAVRLRNGASAGGEKWALKRVQGDGVGFWGIVAPVAAFTVLSACTGGHKLDSKDIALRCADRNLPSSVGWNQLEEGEAGNVIAKCSDAMNEQAALDMKAELGRDFDSKDPAVVKLFGVKLTAVRNRMECKLQIEQFYETVENGNVIRKPCYAPNQ